MTRFRERFEVLRQLGEGAMGIVYEATDRLTSERVALKVLRHLDEEAKARCRGVFNAVAAIDHPNLVHLRDLFEDDELFFTMDLIEGQSPLAYVAVDDGDEYAFDEQRLRSVLHQLTSALTALHERGFVHRDVKPSNMLVTTSGALRLFDYGLMTDPAPIAGSVAYMAPEQHAGPAADFYAMGVLLFQALTGELPFSGLAGEVMIHKRLFEAPKPRALTDRVPHDLDELCTRLLERDPAARPEARQLDIALRVQRR